MTWLFILSVFRLERAIKSDIQLRLMTMNKKIPAWLWPQVRKSIYDGASKVCPYFSESLGENWSNVYNPVNFPLAAPSLILLLAALPLWRHSERLCRINFLQTELQLVRQNKQKNPFLLPRHLTFSIFLFSLSLSLFWNIDNHIYVSPICVATSCWQRAFFFFFPHKRPDKEYVLPRLGL